MLRYLYQLTLALFLGIIATVAFSQDQTDRVFVRDIAGIWIKEEYAQELKRTRMPHRASKKVEPLIIAIKRTGNSYPVMITNFKSESGRGPVQAALQVVLDVEPDQKRGSYRLVLAPNYKPTSADDVKFLWFRGFKNREGKFDKLAMAEIFFEKGKWSNYVNVGDAIGPYFNKIVIAGRYLDKKGRSWEFSPEGQAYLPDQTFYYEVSIRDESSDCDYFEGEDLSAEDGIKRVGFNWKNKQLFLYNARLEGKRIRCDAEPSAILDPQF